MRRLLVAALALVAGCGDDVDLTGVYQVSTVVESMPCGADAPAAMPPAFVRIDKGEIFGAELFLMKECTDAAGTNCSGGGLFSDNTFSEPIDGGWRGVSTASFSGGSSSAICTLRYNLATALLVGAELSVEHTTYSEDVDNTKGLCSTDEAERRNDAMPCVEHQQLDATRL